MKRFARGWPLIPLIWFATLLGVMTPGSLDIRPNVAFEFSLLISDPADIAAFVLRGANASMGRLPGRTDEPEWSEAEDIERRLDAPPQPLAAKYYLEYPSATLALFRLGFPIPCEMPAAVADSHHYGIAHFVPRNDAEASLWLRFQIAAVIHVALMLAALYGLIAVLRRGYEPGAASGPVWLAVLPAAVFFSLNRFDIVPALATALAFFCLGRKRDAWSGACLAMGVLLKVYPVLFVPIVLRHLGVRRGAVWLAGFAGTILLGVGLSTSLLGWEPTVRPVLVQLARPLEEKSWTLYGRVLPQELAHEKNRRLAILAVAGLALVLTRPPSLHSVLRRCAVLLVVFISLAVFWSPQWVVWFLPLVIPLAARSRWLVFTCVALDLLNYFQFPVLFWIIWNHLERSTCESIAEVLIYLRAALWFALAAGLLWAERPRKESS
jgi:hypothetical protein